MTNAAPAYGFAARRPLALLVLAIAIAAGLTIALWLLPLGLLAYLAVVFASARAPELLAQAQRPARPRLSSQTFRAQLSAIERTQQEIGRSATQADGALGRMLAQLQNISANLDNVLAETVRLRTADSASADTATNQVAQRLSDLKADMDAFQRVLDTAMTQTGTP